MRRGRGGAEDDARLAAMGGDGLQRAVQVGAGLGVDQDVIGAGLDEVVDERIHGGDHQVDVEGQARVRAQAGDDRGAETDVGDEMTVHHVEMEPVGAGGLDGADLLGEAGEVGGEEARADQSRQA